jgi:CBS domain-containing protein
MATTHALTRTLIKTDLTWAREDETILDASRRLAHDNVGALPVYDRKHRLTGMITDRDIVVNVVAKGKDPARTAVGDVACEDPVTIDADAPIETAMQLMAQHKVRRLPVVEAGECIGMISQADVARSMPAEETGRMVCVISTD